MSTYNPLIMSISNEYKGLTEWPGAKNNPEIVALFAAVGHEWVKDDETPWCAAFVGSVLAEAGLSNTGKLNADPTSNMDKTSGCQTRSPVTSWSSGVGHPPAGRGTSRSLFGSQGRPSSFGAGTKGTASRTNPTLCPVS